MFPSHLALWHQIARYDILKDLNLFVKRVIWRFRRAPPSLSIIFFSVYQRPRIRDVAYNIWPRCTIVGSNLQKYYLSNKLQKLIPLNYIGVSVKTSKIQYVKSASEWSEMPRKVPRSRNEDQAWYSRAFKFYSLQKIMIYFSSNLCIFIDLAIISLVFAMITI